MTEDRRPLWYIYLLLKNRWFLVKALLIIMIPTVVVTFMLKQKYTVTSLIMPPEEQSVSGLSLGGFSATEFAGYFSGGMGFSLPLMTTMSDVYDEILKSRTLAEHVILSTAFIDSTNLRERYDQNEQVGMYWARLKFRENFKANVTPSGFIRIEYTAGDPWYAVEVSEAIITSLDSINREINTSRLHQSRLFLEHRALIADSMLQAANSALKRFEDEYGMVAPQQEITAYVNQLSALKAEYLTLLTEISALRQGVSGASSPTLLFKQRRSAELFDVINMLESGVLVPGYEDVMPSLSMDDFHDVSFEYAILRTDYETALTFTNAINVSLQEAVAAENREQTSIRILDPPRHPGWKSKPKRSLILIEAFLVAFIFLFGFLVARENVREARRTDPEQWAPWQRLFEDIRSDFSFRRKK
jgi:tyrosine-protein kinase Etk/Wzc